MKRSKNYDRADELLDAAWEAPGTRDTPELLIARAQVRATLAVADTIAMLIEKLP